MTGLLVGAAFVALALLASRYGVDTRDGRDWRVRRDSDRVPLAAARYTIGSDLRLLIGLLRRAGGLLTELWLAQERAWGACWRAHQPWRSDEQSPEQGEPRGGEDGDELRWREGADGWWLSGCRLPAPPAPPAPPTDRPSSEPSASNS